MQLGTIIVRDLTEFVREGSRPLNYRAIATIYRVKQSITTNTTFIGFIHEWGFAPAARASTLPRNTITLYNVNSLTSQMQKPTHRK
jgi:hypothetical protein